MIIKSVLYRFFVKKPQYLAFFPLFFLITTIRHHYHRLHMPTHRKHIAPSHLLHHIPSICQIPQIPCQCSRITAHINHPFRLHPQDCVKAHLVAALSWGIYHDHICIDMAFLILFRQNFLRLPYKKFHIPHSVQLCIPSGIINGLGNDFHPIYLPGLLR